MTLMMTIMLVAVILPVVLLVSGTKLAKSSWMKTVRTDEAHAKLVHGIAAKMALVPTPRKSDVGIRRAYTGTMLSPKPLADEAPPQPLISGREDNEGVFRESVQLVNETLQHAIQIVVERDGADPENLEVQNNRYQDHQYNHHSRCQFHHCSLSLCWCSHLTLWRCC